MNLKQIGMGIVGLVVVIGAAWGFMINSYEEDVGTNNIFTSFILNISFGPFRTE